MINFETIGVAIGAIVTAVIGLWGGIQKARRGQAETKASVAERERDREVADSQKIIYDMLNERLKTVESEVKDVKLYARKLELHISKLEKLMREKGLEVPALEL